MTEHEEHRFRILVCIDGTEESYRSLRYAARMGKGVEADIVLVFVRTIGPAMMSGGLNVNVARENMLKWGLELPGIRYLKKGKDILIEVGYMAPDRREEVGHMDVSGDPLGDNRVTFIGRNERKVILKLKAAKDVATGILEQWELGKYDLIIMGASSRWAEHSFRRMWDPPATEKVAMHAPCPVLVARHLLPGHSHLIYTDGSELAQEVVRRDAYFANMCESLVAIAGVAPDQEGLPEAQSHVEAACAIVESMGIEVYETITRVGDPVTELASAGEDHSVIVVPDFPEKGFRRLIGRGMAVDLMRKAKCSVMVFR